MIETIEERRTKLRNDLAFYTGSLWTDAETKIIREYLTEEITFLTGLLATLRGCRNAPA